MIQEKRKNVYLHDPVQKRADAIIEARGFKGLTDLIVTLIREEYERRHAPVIYGNIPPEKISSDPAVTQAAKEILEAGAQDMLNERPPSVSAPQHTAPAHRPNEASPHSSMSPPISSRRKSKRSGTS